MRSADRLSESEGTVSDNEEHIEALRFKTDASYACQEALAAAIRALKFEDAARAKDESAEARHCLNTAASWGLEGDALHAQAQRLYEQRALARAEVEAKYARLVAVGKRVDEEGWRLAGCTRETLRELQASLRELEGK
jgi:hypothetical protein